MSHSIEEIYRKAKLLHDKALELHRERYRVQGTYDKPLCNYMVEDLQALAGDIKYGLVDLDREFSK